MNAHLLYRNKDFNIEQSILWNSELLLQDFGLKILFDCMSGGDDLIFTVAKKVILSSTFIDEATIHYRQEILKDCLTNSSVIEAMYKLSIEAVESRKHTWYSIFTKHPTSVLSGSVGLMNIYLDYLKSLRDYVKQHEGRFSSEGFVNLFSVLKKEISDEYIDEVKQQLLQLKSKDGILMSAQLGAGNKGVNYTLHSFTAKRLNWLQKMFPPKLPGYTFQINPRDESGARAVAELNDNAVRKVANIVADANEHILNFFTVLRNELAFWLGNIRLHQRFSELGLPFCFPKTYSSTHKKHNCKNLYDACLALSMNKKIETNDLIADDKNLIIITGANKGGKSTFLRSIGTAQLMMQCGMFMAAEKFEANLCSGVFTHFKREENNTMESGKFDEELKRMDDITNHLKPTSLLLFNESFAATNEREGSEVARQIINALLESDNKIFFVTHLHDLSNGYFKNNQNNILFLRANDDNSFKLKEDAPQKTSNGVELYRKIFNKK
ncbi:DNA mismatch repair protein MutS [Arachidicoccus ginsenosidimutans]|nr:DNA mismatch repair protein MutS [Arachidicoccus sp. BS20]